MSKIALVCAGLGGINRGFEVHMHKMAELLSKDQALQIAAFSGYHNSKANYPHKKLAAVSRNHPLIKLWSADLHKQFHFEQQSLFLPLLYALKKFKPDVIYLGEYRLYCYLFKARKLLGLTWGLCLHTGGQAIPGPFDKNKDWVHHVSDRYWTESLQSQIPVNRQFLLPHIVDDPGKIDHSDIPAHLKINTPKKIVLSVGSIDETVKGMETLVNCLGLFPEKYFPVLIGPLSSQSEAIRNKLNHYFGKDYVLTEHNSNDLPFIYAQADLFVSLSKKESFGLVMLEAMLQNTPVIMNSWEGSAYIFQDKVSYFETDSSLQELESQIRQNLGRPRSLAERDYVLNRFSGTRIENEYLEMFKAIAEH